jgi:hypothetical protein
MNSRSNAMNGGIFAQTTAPIIYTPQIPGQPQQQFFGTFSGQGASSHRDAYPVTLAIPTIQEAYVQFSPQPPCDGFQGVDVDNELENIAIFSSTLPRNAAAISLDGEDVWETLNQRLHALLGYPGDETDTKWTKAPLQNLRQALQLVEEYNRMDHNNPWSMTDQWMTNIWSHPNWSWPQSPERVTPSLQSGAATLPSMQSAAATVPLTRRPTHGVQPRFGEENGPETPQASSSSQVDNVTAHATASSSSQVDNVTAHATVVVPVRPFVANGNDSVAAALLCDPVCASDSVLDGLAMAYIASAANEGNKRTNYLKFMQYVKEHNPQAAKLKSNDQEWQNYFKSYKGREKKKPRI